jgi:hypothetical protein
MSGATIQIPTKKSDIDALLQYGLLVESVTYPNLPMGAVMSKLASSAGDFNLTALTGAVDAERRVAVLNALIPTLPHDVRSARYIAGYWAVTSVSAAAVALRLYTRTKYTGRIRTEDKWAIIAAV